MIRRILRKAFSLSLVVFAGCSGDERLARQAERASDRQAEQNRQIARQNQELAQATNQLVAADAEARTESLALQRELQAAQVVLGQQRDALEAERRQTAQSRMRDPVVAAAIKDLGILAACLAPLLLCGYLVKGLKYEPADQELAELLAVELVSESPVFLPPRDALPGRSRLTGNREGLLDEDSTGETSDS